MCIAAVEMMLICVWGAGSNPRSYHDPIAQPNSYAQFGQRYRQVAYSDAENKDGGHRKVCGLPIAILAASVRFLVGRELGQLICNELFPLATGHLFCPPL